MKRIFWPLINLLIGLSMVIFASCNKDEEDSNTLEGIWALIHKEWNDDIGYHPQETWNVIEVFTSLEKDNCYREEAYYGEADDEVWWREYESNIVRVEGDTLFGNGYAIIEALSLKKLVLRRYQGGYGVSWEEYEKLSDNPKDIDKFINWEYGVWKKSEQNLPQKRFCAKADNIDADMF